MKEENLLLIIPKFFSYEKYNAIVNIRHNNKIGNKLINKFGNCKYQATTNKINGKLKIPYINPFIKGFKSIFFNDAKKIGN